MTASNPLGSTILQVLHRHRMARRVSSTQWLIDRRPKTTSFATVREQIELAKRPAADVKAHDLAAIPPKRETSGLPAPDCHGNHAFSSVAPNLDRCWPFGRVTNHRLGGST